MAKFSTHDRKKDEEHDTGKPDTAALLIEALGEWIAVTGKGLPAECPQDRMDFVHWWMHEMQEPAMPGEDRLLAVGQNGMRWELGYFVRIRTAMFRFLELSTQDRAFVIAARQDRIHWRGDDMDMFQSIYNETMRAREMGLGAYRVEALKNLERKLGVRVDA